MFGLRRSPGALLFLLAIVTSLALATATEAQPAPVKDDKSLPFFVGEEIVYGIRSSRAGSVGHGKMMIEGPVDVNGVRTYELSFDVNTRVGPVRAVNHTRSWLDPVGMAAVRFQKREKHPLTTHEEDVDLYPRERRWRAADGASGESPTAAPLDELSFIYFVRTLPLAPDYVASFDRHFEMDRNPIVVRVRGREVVKTNAGEFMTLIVEMRVRDPRRYRGEGIIRINISDDECRLPVRIESTMPVLGTAVLTLESHSHPASHFPTIVD